MIREDDLNQAIAECQSERDPNAWTCIRLAAFYILRGELFGDTEQLPKDYAAAPMLRGASMAEAQQTPDEVIVNYTSPTEFAKAIDGKRAAQIWPVLDEAMSILQTMHPKLYKAILKRI